MKRPIILPEKHSTSSPKLESCRQAWYSFLGNEAQRRS
jgi:hypothetical protein